MREGSGVGTPGLLWLQVLTFPLEMETGTAMGTVAIPWGRRRERAADTLNPGRT